MNNVNKFLFPVLISLLSWSVQAQQRKAVSFQQQVQSQKAAQSPSVNVEQSPFRITAGVEVANADLSSLNAYRDTILWNGTTVTTGSFNNLTGFNIGAGYYWGPGYLSLEFNRESQDLPATLVTGTGTSVQDSIEMETLQLAYDWVFQKSQTGSFELGLSAGMATQFKFINIFTATGYHETLYWNDTPFVFKLRAFYNYHFSQQVRLRVGLAYESITSDNLKADSNHPNLSLYGAPITSGQKLLDVQGKAVKVDASGARGLLGLEVAF